MVESHAFSAGGSIPTIVPNKAKGQSFRNPVVDRVLDSLVVFLQLWSAPARQSAVEVDWEEDMEDLA